MSEATKDMLLGYLLNQTTLQQALLEKQQEIIRLHETIRKLTPPPPDEDVNWHRVSGGVTSEETLKTDDLEQIKQFYEWLQAFGEKYIKPYVHLRVYAEIMAQMTRGLPSKIAGLEVQAEFGVTPERSQAQTLRFPSDESPPENIKPHPPQNSTE